MILRLPFFAVALALAGCGAAGDDGAGDGGGDGATSADNGGAAPTAEERAAQAASGDCAGAAAAYAEALAARDFDLAAQFWDDPVIDGLRLAALFDGYASPRMMISKVRETSDAGAHSCTVTGALDDAQDPSRALRPGEIELRRQSGPANADGANQRWIVRSSTFIEPMERSGTGAPA